MHCYEVVFVSNRGWDVGAPYPLVVWVEDEDDVAGVVTATVRAIRRVMENPDEAPVLS